MKIQVNMEKDLSKIKLLTGETAEEFLSKVPEQFRSAATEALYACLNQKLPLIEPVVQRVARAIIRERGIEKKTLRLRNV